MPVQFPPPATFIKSHGAADVFAGRTSLFATEGLVGPCTVTRIFVLPNVTAGQPSSFPVRLFTSFGFPRIVVGDILLNGTVWGEWQARAGRELVVDENIEISHQGVLLGTWLIQTSGISMIQSSRFSFLPWVDGAPPDLRRTQTPRSVQRFNFSNVVVPVGTRVIRSTPLINSPYIITTITYRSSTTGQAASSIRPFVSMDTATTVPAGLTARAGAVPGEDIMSRTRDATGIIRAGHLGCHTQYQNLRPWKNVRFVPSAIKLLFESAVGTQTFTATVEIEYLPPKPWWKEASLLELARGL